MSIPKKGSFASKHLPSIAIGVLALFVLICLISYCCTNETEDSSFSWTITIVLICIFCFLLWFKPWNWNWRFWKKSTSTSTTTPTSTATPPSFSTKKFMGNSWNIALSTLAWGVVVVVVVFVALLLYQVYGLHAFSKNQVDKSARGDMSTVQVLQHGTYHFIAGERHVYYHSDVPEYFRPTNNGDSIHVILRSRANPSLYHEYVVVRNKNNTIGRWETISNTLTNTYEYYTVELVRDGDITYSDKSLADSKE